VGFIELSGPSEHVIKSHPSLHEGPNGAELPHRSRVQRHLEKSWPIREQLKSNKADDLFAWIGRRIAEVVKDGCAAWPGELPEELPLGVTFSFPMMSVKPSSRDFLLTFV
jgi:hexokinase